MTDNQPSCPICKGEVREHYSEKSKRDVIYCPKLGCVYRVTSTNVQPADTLHALLSQLRVDKDEAVDLLKQIQEQIPSILEKFSKAERMLNEISKP